MEYSNTQTALSATQSLTSTNQRIKLVTIGKTCLALGDRPKG